jgi:hypothetical protein
MAKSATDKTLQRSEPRLLPRLIILRSEPLADRRRSADRSRARVFSYKRPPSNGVELGIVGPARSRFDRHVRMAIPRLPSGRRPPLPMKLLATPRVPISRRPPLPMKLLATPRVPISRRPPLPMNLLATPRVHSGRRRPRLPGALYSGARSAASSTPAQTLAAAQPAP